VLAVMAAFVFTASTLRFRRDLAPAGGGDDVDGVPGTTGGTAGGTTRGTAGGTAPSVTLDVAPAANAPTEAGA
jgi:hypothetical protein